MKISVLYRYPCNYKYQQWALPFMFAIKMIVDNFAAYYCYFNQITSFFRQIFYSNRGLVCQISCRDCNAVYVGETGRSVRTRKREHVDAVKTFNTKKSALSQHVMEFDHRIDWDNVKILKSESHAYRRGVAESFLINQKACSCNVINRNDGANFPTVYSVFVSNK